MVQNQKELEWKNHAPFFTNLNDDLRNLKVISQSRDMKKARLYLEHLDNLKVHYSVYVATKSIREKIKECKDVLYSTMYDGKWSPEYYKQLLQVQDLLREIHEDLIKGFYDNDLIPRITENDVSRPAAVRNNK